MNWLFLLQSDPKHHWTQAKVKVHPCCRWFQEHFGGYCKGNLSIIKSAERTVKKMVHSTQSHPLRTTKTKWQKKKEKKVQKWYKNLSLNQMISETLGPGKINKLPQQEAITMRAFKVKHVFFLISNELECSLDFYCCLSQLLHAQLMFVTVIKCVPKWESSQLSCKVQSKYFMGNGWKANDANSFFCWNTWPCFNLVYLLYTF